MPDKPVIDLVPRGAGIRRSFFSRLFGTGGRRTTLARSDSSEVVGGKAASLDRADPYSLEWAKVVKPITWSLLALLAAVMLLPFALISVSSPAVRVVPPAGTQPAQIEVAGRLTAAAVEAASVARTKDMLDWAKTVLPSVVGFASAMVGYYFGTRPSQGDPTKGGTQDRSPTPRPSPPGSPESQGVQGAQEGRPSPGSGGGAGQGATLDLTGRASESGGSTET